MENVVTINSVTEFHDFFSENFLDAHYIFRGEDKTTYELRSQFGRDLVRNSKNTPRMERSYFDDFKRKGLPFLEFDAKDNWDWIAVAQHYGLHTRLLDWTTNPLVAAYFAVNRTSLSNSVIYAFDTNDLQDANFSMDPFSIESNCVFRPKHLSRRISAQSGLFTIHNKPNELFVTQTMRKIIIDCDINIDLWLMLDRYGINEFTMFPDLHGLANDLTKSYIWG